MSFSRASEERHLYPLLEFLRYLSYQGREVPSEPVVLLDDQSFRLPRRFHGSSVHLLTTGAATDVPQGSQSSLADKPTEAPLEAAATTETLPERGDSVDIVDENDQIDSTPVPAGDEGEQNSDSKVSPTSAEPRYPLTRKRVRGDYTPIVASSPPASLDCLFVGEAHNGVANAQYLDIPLSEFGAELLVPALRLRRAEGQRLLGQPCCYLNVGTSRVVTGTIVDTGVRTVQILPDERHNVPLRWVDLSHLYKAPPAVDQFQQVVTEGYSAELRRIAASRKTRR